MASRMRFPERPLLFRLGAGLLRHFEEVVGAAALIVVVLAVCWGVVTRYITAQPATWAGEVAAIAFAWLVFIGAGAALKRNMHVSIDMLVLALPERVQSVLTRLIDAFVLAFLAYALFLSAEFTVEAWDNPSSVLRVPMSVVYAGVAIGFASLLLRYVQAALPRYRPRRAGEARP